MSAGSRILELLAPLTNYERSRPDRVRWSLDAMQRLLARPGARALRGRAVQIAGSKGKGTTAMYVGCFVRAAGRRSGVYLSPHVEEVVERVQIDGQAATDLETSVREVVEFARREGLEMSFFEAMTAAAVDCFARAEVDVAALEVGLGGRLDATTAVPVDAVVITTIELEHTEILGDTVEAIAAEKAGAIRPGRPVITGARGAALAVIEARAEAVGAPIWRLGREVQVVELRDLGDGFAGKLIAPGVARPFELRGAARFEVDAAALAFAALLRVCPELELPLRPMPRPDLPGRFERWDVPGLPTLILDGAHTVESLGVVAAELRRRFPEQRPTVLFASARGKRWREGLSRLCEVADTFVVTNLAETASEDSREIAAWLLARGRRARAVEDAAAGLAALAGAPGLAVVTGSFYLVGRVRRLLRQRTLPADRP
jgi:dihydrofolate synthase/folylpolyglutamate synthase